MQILVSSLSAHPGPRHQESFPILERDDGLLAIWRFGRKRTMALQPVSVASESRKIAPVG